MKDAVTLTGLPAADWGYSIGLLPEEEPELA
jgi:hypothetical protein